jgi:hypothetical protein
VEGISEEAGISLQMEVLGMESGPAFVVCRYADWN